MTRDQALRRIIDGTVTLKGKESKIDVTLIREPDSSEKLERYYRQHGWTFAQWRTYWMDDGGAGIFYLRRRTERETEAEALFNLFDHHEWFIGRKKWDERELLAGGIVTIPEELTRQLNALFASVPADAVRGRKGWTVAEIVETKEHGTIRIRIRKAEPEK